MGFSANTLVLTDKGYWPISGLRPRTRLLTPLGKTHVNFVGRVVDLGHLNSLVLSPSVTVMGDNLFYQVGTPGTHIGVVETPENQQLVKIGIVSGRPPVSVEHLTHQTLFSFSDSGLDSEQLPFVPSATLPEVWVLGTENQIAVVGTFLAVAIANLQPGCSPPSDSKDIALGDLNLNVLANPYISHMDAQLFSAVVSQFWTPSGHPVLAPRKS